MKLVDPVELGFPSFYCECNKSTVKPQEQALVLELQGFGFLYICCEIMCFSFKTLILKKKLISNILPAVVLLCLNSPVLYILQK